MLCRIVFRQHFPAAFLGAHPDHQDYIKTNTLLLWKGLVFPTGPPVRVAWLRRELILHKIPLKEDRSDLSQLKDITRLKGPSLT